MNRTTTILAADVAAYARMLAVNETATIAALERVREEVVLPAIRERGGSIVRLTGDGSLIEFPSVAAAADMAFALQSWLRREGVEPSPGLPLLVRIGIHHGELNPSGLEPHGEAINIAVRLQEIAQPGAVAISGIVHGLLGARGNRMFAPLGERLLKHINEPVAVWMWRADGGGLAGHAALGSNARTSGRQILDRRVVDLIVDLHMRSSRLATSDAFDQLLATRPPERPFTLQEIFAVMGEQLNASRAMLAPIHIALVDDHAEHLSDMQDEQSMNEYIRRVFNNARTAFAMELLPKIAAILESDQDVLAKRRAFLALVVDHMDTHMAGLTKRYIKYGFVEIN